ncbi:hypothetical protein Q3G72_006996 [Acer saccharum]|nr:hypothetical protein Q3G72_006996 [Acer saccharum]
MQRAVRSLFSNGNAEKTAVLERFRVANPMMLRPVVFSWFQSALSAPMEEHGFESTWIADVLKAKGKGADGSWLWCATDDSVYDAVKSHNVGALVIVKPGEKIQLRESSLRELCEIVIQLYEIIMLCLSLCPHLHSPLHRCLQDYIRNIIMQGRSSKSTKVGDIMTEENKQITVKPDTKVLIAMQLMTDNLITHTPAIDDKEMIVMVSIADVVRAVISEHREELDRLTAYIQGGY